MCVEMHDCVIQTPSYRVTFLKSLYAKSQQEIENRETQGKDAEYRDFYLPHRK